MSPTRFLPVIAACVLAGACDAKVSARPSSGGVSVSFSSDSAADRATAATGESLARTSRPTFAEGPDGSVSMSTRNGTMVMALRHDSVVVAFSDSIRQHVRQKLEAKLDEQRPQESAIGQVVQGVVAKGVTGALSEVFDKARGFPVASLRGVRYEEGEIRFDYVKKPAWTFDEFETDGTPLLSQFHPADAARFVGAVRARMRGA